MMTILVGRIYDYSLGRLGYMITLMVGQYMITLWVGRIYDYSLVERIYNYSLGRTDI